MKKQAAILLIEDDRVDVMLIQRAFKKNKITNPLYVVGDGEEALAFLRRTGQFAGPDSPPRPGLILLDLDMPRMTGLEFLRIIKIDLDLYHIPVVALTTSNMGTDVKASFRSGVAGYIVKPVTFDKFVQAIAALDLYWTLSEFP